LANAGGQMRTSIGVRERAEKMYTTDLVLSAAQVAATDLLYLLSREHGKEARYRRWNY
jgi:hypothetical protein